MNEQRPLKPTVLDRCLLKVAPERGLRRMLAKERVREFGYDAASPGTLRGWSGGHAKNAASESWRSARDAVQIMWDARDCVRNVGILGGLVAKLAMYVTGRLSYKANTGAEGADKIITDWFHEQCKPENIDLTGRHRLRKMVELGFRGAVVDGRFGFAPVRETPTAPLKFQMIEGDRIGNPLEAMQSETYIRGLHLDAQGKVLGYRIFDRKRTGQYANPRDLPANNFIYLWDPERADEYGGVSWLQRALPKARDYYEWFAIEMATAKHHSTYSAFLRSKTGFTGANQWDGQTPNGTPTQEAVFGRILQLGEGEDVTLVQTPARPSGSFLDGLQALAREVALALNLPFGFVYNMALLGGVTARIEIMQAVRVIQHWQHDVLEPPLTQLKDMKLADGVARGDIPATFRDRGDGVLVPSWMCGHWEFGPWLTGDVGNQTNADLSLLAAGIKTPDDLSAEYMGRPASETAEKITANVQMHQRLGAESGVPLELQAPGRFAGATPLLASANTPPAPPPEPGSQAAVGDHGMKQIVEILTAVSEGRLERDSAIQTLITGYGLNDEQADDIVPTPKKAKPEKTRKNP